MPWTANLLSAQAEGGELVVTIAFRNDPREHLVSYRLAASTSAAGREQLRRLVAERLTALQVADSGATLFSTGPVPAPLPEPPPPPPPPPPPADLVHFRSRLTTFRQWLKGVNAGLKSNVDSDLVSLRADLASTLAARPEWWAEVDGHLTR